MAKTRNTAAARNAYGQTLVELGRARNDIVVLDADLSSSTRTAWFAQAFPERFFDCGVAEANLITIAAGLATCGKIPFASTFAVFGTERAYNQIRQSIAYTRLNVKLVCSHSGITVGPDGASHHTVFDIAIMRVLPNMVTLVPADAPETAEAVRAMVDYNGPVYMRLGRTPVPVIYDEPYSFNGQRLQFQIGQSVELTSGNDVTIICNGLMVAEALDAAEALKAENIQVRVVNMHTIKPLDIQAICKAAQETGAIVTAEEHSIIGGLGSAVSEVVVQNYPVPMGCVGVNDIFTESGTDTELLQIYDLTATRLITTVRAVMQQK